MAQTSKKNYKGNLKIDDLTNETVISQLISKVHQHAEMYPKLYAAECCFIEGSMNIPWTTNDVYLLATSSRFVHLEL